MTRHRFDFTTGKADDMVDMPAANATCFASADIENTGTWLDTSLR